MSRNNQQDKQILHLDKKVEKHIETTNAELGILKIDVAVIKTIVSEHKWLIRVILLGVVALIFKAFI